MEWINIEDKLPPENVWILGGNPTRVDSGVWLNDLGFVLPDFSYMPVKITHWMPIPEAPTDECPLVMERKYFSREEAEKFLPNKGGKMFISEIPDFAEEMKELEEMAQDDSFRVFSLIDLLHRVLEKFQKAKEEEETLTELTSDLNLDFLQRRLYEQLDRERTANHRKGKKKKME